MASTQENANQSTPAMESSFNENLHDFSLVLGGPIFQLFRRSHLSGNGLELLHRRLLTITLIAWLPMLLLASLGAQLGGVSRLSFFRDVEVAVLCLVVRRFVDRRIVLPDDLTHFDRAIQSAVRFRNSIPVEAALVIFVYSVGL